MSEKEYFINDNVIIPEEIRRMTKEERQVEIKRLEEEAAAEKQRLLKQKRA